APSLVGAAAVGGLPGGGLRGAGAGLAVHPGERAGQQEAKPWARQRCQVPGTALPVPRLAAGDRRGAEAHPRGPRGAPDQGTWDRLPAPRVLDMFAGGGAIPLEALRLGCEAYALDLNPVAHIIELCTLVYPQKYGKSDPTARGATGPKNAKGETAWGGLAGEVRYWGTWVLEKVRAEI